MDNNYVQACVVTGRTENLKMHAARNLSGNVVGWVFVHTEIDVDNVDVMWNLGVKPKSETNDPSDNDPHNQF